MPIDPRRYAMTPEGRTAERLADVERGLALQQRSSLNAVTAVSMVETQATFQTSSTAQASFGLASFDPYSMWDPAHPPYVTLPYNGVYHVIAKAQVVGNGSTAHYRVDITGVTTSGLGNVVLINTTQTINLETSEIALGVAGSQLGASVFVGNGVLTTFNVVHLCVVYLGRWF